MWNSGAPGWTAELEYLVDRIDYPKLWQRVMEDPKSESKRGNYQHNHLYATQDLRGNRCKFTGASCPRARESSMEPIIVGLLQVLTTIGALLGMVHPGMKTNANPIDRFRFLMFAGAVSSHNMYEWISNCVTESDKTQWLVVNHGDNDNAPEPDLSNVLITGRWYLKRNHKDPNSRPVLTRVSNISGWRKEVSDSMRRMKQSAGMVQLAKEWLRLQPNYRSHYDPTTFHQEAVGKAGMLMGPHPDSIPAAMHLTPVDRNADVSCLIHFANECVKKHNGDIIMWEELMFPQNFVTEFYKLCNIIHELTCMEELPNECLSVTIGRYVEYIAIQCLPGEWYGKLRCTKAIVCRR